MIIYLRNKDTRVNYFDTEFWQTLNDDIELKASVYSENCFELLLSKDISDEYKEKFAFIMGCLEELRGWYYEVYLNKENKNDFKKLLLTLRGKMKIVAKELDLIVVED